MRLSWMVVLFLKDKVQLEAQQDKLKQQQTRIQREKDEELEEFKKLFQKKVSTYFNSFFLHPFFIELSQSIQHQQRLRHSSVL